MTRLIIKMQFDFCVYRRSEQVGAASDVDLARQQAWNESVQGQFIIYRHLINPLIIIIIIVVIVIMPPPRRGALSGDRRPSSVRPSVRLSDVAYIVSN